MKWRWYVYIVECLDDTYYTGCTWKVPSRYEQHLSKFGSKYTREHGVRRLVYCEEYDNLGDARRREKQIKDWSRAKKEKLIKGEWKKW